MRGARRSTGLNLDSSEGESLQEFSDSEWKRAKPAYAVTQINSKSSTTKITVFSAKNTNLIMRKNDDSCTEEDLESQRAALRVEEANDSLMKKSEKKREKAEKKQEKKMEDEGSELERVFGGEPRKVEAEDKKQAKKRKKREKKEAEEPFEAKPKDRESEDPISGSVEVFAKSSGEKSGSHEPAFPDRAEDMVKFICEVRNAFKRHPQVARIDATICLDVPNVDNLESPTLTKNREFFTGNSDQRGGRFLSSK
ncbi:hypothetical protein L596_009029 [Steinernema carpocapsae]|uniref:Uncharacterized protein n=1 Tax=Steinernema carpocapsae TaxID=34508 RepID=A0A4U5PEJ7_STECR|nr:hypothetical protein L596_009029 [Steinernema carpocapsae]